MYGTKPSGPQVHFVSIIYIMYQYIFTSDMSTAFRANFFLSFIQYV